MSHRTFSRLTALALVLSVAACGGDSGTGPGPVKPPPTSAAFALTAARNFVAGDTALISGTTLSAIASITIDGQSVPFTVVNDTLRAIVPSSIGRVCDVDGRLVEVKAVGNASSGGATVSKSFPLTVSATQNLSIGQSVVLSTTDLQCLRLSAGSAAYVLSALDLARGNPTTYASSFDTLGTLTVSDGGGVIAPPGTPGASGSLAAPTARFGAALSGTSAFDDRSSIATAMRSLANLRTSSRASVSLRTRGAVMAPGTLRSAHAGGYVESSNNPSLDPHLLTANVGDQFTIIDWRKGLSDPAVCTDAVSSLPHMAVVVLAVSGKTVIMVDASLPGLPDYTSAAGLAHWKAVADSTEASYLPAVRSVLSATYTPLQSADGRVFTLITDLSASGGGRGEEGTMAPAALAPRSICPNSPEIQLALLASAGAGTGANSATSLASVIVHEQTHVADAVLGNSAASGGARAWMVEALAVSAEESAWRVRAGVTHQAPMNSGIPFTLPLPNGSRYSTWGPTVGDPSGFASGMYQPGMQILLHAREKAGQADPLSIPSGATLYERMLTMPRSNQFSGWTVDELASLVGMTGNDLLDESVTAALTDDAASTPLSIPQFDSWKGLSLASRLAMTYNSEPTHILGRGVARTQLVATGAGSYDYWYIGGAYSQSGFGASFKFESASNAPTMRVRLTRLQ